MLFTARHSQMSPALVESYLPTQAVSPEQEARHGIHEMDEMRNFELQPRQAAQASPTQGQGFIHTTQPGLEDYPHQVLFSMYPVSRCWAWNPV